MFVDTKLGKLPEGIVYATLLTYSKKGNLLKEKIVYLGSRPKFLRIRDEVLAVAGEFCFILDSDTVVSQGMLYETRWPKSFIGRTLCGIMDENIIYDHNLRPTENQKEDK